MKARRFVPTAELLRILEKQEREKGDEAELWFMMGEDCLKELPSWYASLEGERRHSSSAMAAADGWALLRHESEALINTANFLVLPRPTLPSSNKEHLRQERLAPPSSEGEPRRLLFLDALLSSRGEAYAVPALSSTLLRQALKRRQGGCAQVLAEKAGTLRGRNFFPHSEESVLGGCLRRWRSVLP